MMKKIKIILLAVLLVLLSLTAFAAAPSLVDEAGLIPANEQQEVVKALQNVEAKHKMRLAVITKKTVDGELGKFANQLIDKNYSGEKGGAMILVIDTKSGKWYVATDKVARQAITDDYGVKEVAKSFTEELKKKHYSKAAQNYAKITDEYMTYFEQNGKAKAAETKKDHNWLLLIAVALAGGGIAVFVVRHSLIASMSNVLPALSATAYLKEGTFQLSQSDDTFLYTNVVVEKLEKKEDDPVEESSADDDHGGGGGSLN